jgi:hypothetical protein
MGHGDFLVEHMNDFDTIMTQMILVGVKMDDEDHCVALLCSLLDSWDNLVMAIGSIV